MAAKVCQSRFSQSHTVQVVIVGLQSHLVTLANITTVVPSVLLKLCTVQVSIGLNADWLTI